MKRVVITHQWGGSPESDFYPWLKAQLEERGFEVVVSAMPNPAAPEVEAWVKTLGEAVGTLDENTILVGHSVGCQTILRYLVSKPWEPKRKIVGIVLVAPWLKLSEEVTNDPEQMRVAKPWLEDLPKPKLIAGVAKEMWALFSDNDPYVSLENAELLKEYGFKSEVFPNRFHFDAESGITEVPEVLEKILEIVK
ncbi:MAG TPA: DUF1749 domain-containing protein [Candidatus Paceibacterota bacterium]